MQRCTILILTLLCISLAAQAQFVRVVNIECKGNDRTKERIILREIDFKVGDRIQQSQLATKLEWNEFLILRTGLFTEVKMNVIDWDTENDEVSIEIFVREGPRFIAVPIFELADRNFNVWWNEFNASFQRVNYGANVYLNNAWGLSERFKLSAQGGFTPKVEFSTLLPFLDYSQNIRLELDLNYSQNREIAMVNEDNRQIFFQRDGNTIFRRHNYVVGVQIRQGIYANHTLRFGYNNNRIDSVMTNEINPNFFLDGRTRQRYVFAEYQYTIDKRDLPVFPTRGWRTRLNFIKEGFGFTDDISSTYIRGLYEYNFPLGDKFSAGVMVSGQLALERNQQPYYNYEGLGYGENFVRGYELYVVDGLDYFLTKTQLRYRVLTSVINWKKLMPVKSMRYMPWQLYLSMHFDSGYVNDPFYSELNSFTNRWTHGAGVGISVLMYNTFSFTIEGSVNHRGEKGIFFSSNTAF